MEQLYRDQFAHYINTTPGDAETWTLEGVGVENLALSYNPQISQFKTIINRVADATFNNYQVQTSVSGKRIYKGDAIYEFLDEARRNMKAIETQFMEVEMANTKTENNYVATKFNCLIVIDEFLGENATISYTLYVKGDPTHGTVAIADGKPTFTPTM
jgi:DNA-directed RNA polymerase beta' subunit